MFRNLTGPSPGAFCTNCICRLWYVVVRVLPHTKLCKYSLYKILLMMDRWGPKHVELTEKCWIKTYSLRPHCVSCWTTYIYYKMIHDPYNVKFIPGSLVRRLLAHITTLFELCQLNRVELYAYYEWLNGKDAKGSNTGLLWYTSWIFHGRLENHGNPPYRELRPRVNLWTSQI